MVRAIYGVQLKARKRSTNLTFMQDQLAMANSARWNGHVLRREDGHVLRKTLHIEVEVQKKKGRSTEEMKAKENIEEAGEEERMKVRLSMEDALCRSM